MSYFVSPVTRWVYKGTGYVLFGLWMIVVCGLLTIVALLARPDTLEWLLYLYPLASIAFACTVFFLMVSIRKSLRWLMQPPKHVEFDYGEDETIGVIQMYPTEGYKHIKPTMYGTIVDEPRGAPPESLKDG